MAFCIIAGNVPQNNHTVDSMLLHLGAADAFKRHYVYLLYFCIVGGVA